MAVGRHISFCKGGGGVTFPSVREGASISLSQGGVVISASAMARRTSYFPTPGREEVSSQRVRKRLKVYISVCGWYHISLSEGGAKYLSQLRRGKLHIRTSQGVGASFFNQRWREVLHISFSEGGRLHISLSQKGRLHISPTEGGGLLISLSEGNKRVPSYFP